ncbi:MAG: S-layer homology domain-containing protein, partial [Eggerthellaceae bacterium]|nr:S-layer homology domain-containing protein [Eggerthellaceae bacterium]
ATDITNTETYDPTGQRNIFVTITDKDFENSEAATYTEYTDTVWLTDYTAADGITPRTPQMVQISDDMYLIMWEEQYADTGDVVTQLATIDAQGNIISQATKSNLTLSQCEPILCSDGLVRWYSATNSTVTLYTVNPKKLDSDTITPNDLIEPDYGSFFDVGIETEANSWYYEAVYQLAARGIITGYTQYDVPVFGVDDTMTRGDFVTILWRLACPDEYAEYDQEAAENTTPFDDVMDASYDTRAIDWAVEQGLVTGYVDEENETGHFGTNDPINFQQMITILGRLIVGAEEIDEYDTSILDSDAFTDADTIDNYARGAMAWAIDNGIVTGNEYEDGVFTISPDVDVARQRVATVLWRAMEAGLINY